MNGFLFLATALFCLAMAIVIVWLNPRRVINQAMGLASLFVSISYFCTYTWAVIIIGVSSSANPIPEALFWLRMNGATYAIVPWTFWLMKHAIVSNHESLLTLIRRSWLIFAVSCVLICLCFTESYISSDSTTSSPQRGMGYILFSVGLYVLFGIIILGAFRTAQQISGVRRIEMHFFILNGCAVGLLIIVVNVIRRAAHIPYLVYAPLIMTVIGFGILLWAVCYHRVFDARQVMITLGQRLTMLAILAGSAYGLTLLLSPQIGQGVGLMLSVILAGIIVYYSDQITRKWLGLDPDQLLAKPRAEIISFARTVTDPDVLRGKFEEFLRNWCQTDLAEVLVVRENACAGRRLAIASQDFIRVCRQGWVTPERLQRLRSDPVSEESLGLMSSQGLAAVIAVPREGEVPSLIIALGPKHSLRPYTYPDISLLLNLAELMDNILTHAYLSNHAAKIAQMESAAMMSRGLAHDLNNLTTPVSTYLLHNEGRDKPGSPEAEVYHAARHSILVMLDYIRESLFFARRMVPELKALSSVEMLSSTVRLATERAARRKVRLKIVPGEAVGFTADAALVQRLVLNLVNNAIDASQPGAVVEISAAPRDQEQICFAVTDHGSGIPAENLKRIFDPYFTTKDTGDEMRGLGLGLAICRKIADLHGGSLEVSSVPGQGSTFTAVFPIKPSPVTKSKDTEDAVADAAPSSFS